MDLAALNSRLAVSSVTAAESSVTALVAKLVALTGCSPGQLETFQLLQYTEGQEFQVHTDGFAGQVSWL